MIILYLHFVGFVCHWEHRRSVAMSENNVLHVATMVAENSQHSNGQCINQIYSSMKDRRLLRELVLILRSEGVQCLTMHGARKCPWTNRRSRSHQ